MERPGNSPAFADARSAHAVLRAATRDAHDRVDQGFGRFRLETDDGYADFLAAQARAFLPTEAALDRAGAADVLADWPERRRAEALLADLSDVGRAAPPIATITVSGPAAILGAAYVIEGSRLGGAFLARSLPPGAPRRFLAPVDGGRWRRLLTILDDRLRSVEDMRAAVDAASAVFAMFEASPRTSDPL